VLDEATAAVSPIHSLSLAATLIIPLMQVDVESDKEIQAIIRSEFAAATT